MQALKAEVTIQVPENMVLVDKTEYLALKEQPELGKIWTVSLDFARVLIGYAGFYGAIKLRSKTGAISVTWKVESRDTGSSPAGLESGLKKTCLGSTGMNHCRNERR